MTIAMPAFSERVLNEFAERERNKTLSYLRKQFSLSRDDCEDIFQESFITLYTNITSGKLETLTSSLSAYFIGICRNKAKEALRRKSKMTFDIFVSLDDLNDEIQSEKIDSLLNMEDNSNLLWRLKQSLVRKIVRDMHSPCKELLKGYIWDRFSMKTLAQMYNYESENSVKVTKHRCQKKFEKRYEELKGKLPDEEMKEQLLKEEMEDQLFDSF